MFSKKDVLNYYILLLVVVMAFSVILLYDNPIYHILSFWSVVIVAIFISGFDIMHPYFWFSCSFALYSTAYSILYVLNYPINSGYSKENLLLSMIAYSTTIFIFGIEKIDNIQINKIQNYDLLNNNNIKKILQLILIILLIILLISVVIIIRTPFTHKNQLLSNRNIFFIVGIYANRYLTFFCCFYTLLFINKEKKSKFFILSSFILILLFTLFTGERDAIFRFTLVLIMTLFITKKLSKKLFLMLIPIGILGITMLTYYKYYFVNGTIKLSFQQNTFIYNFLNSDFSAAGGNLQILLNNTWTKSLHGFSLIAIDFISPFFPGKFFFNVGNWFNNTFYFGSYSRAFTLIGEGYVISGVLGVFIIFAILGCGIKTIYKKASKNIYWLAVYVYSIPTIISSFRSTLATITVALIRIVLVSIIILKFLGKITSKKSAQIR